MRWLGIALLVAVLAACSRVEPAQVWLGTSEASDTGASRTLRLEVHERGVRLTGDYYVENARGDFDGQVEAGGVLTATLTAGPTCTFELQGTIAGTWLTASFVPLVCPGGETGVWSLERQ